MAKLIIFVQNSTPPYIFQKQGQSLFWKGEEYIYPSISRIAIVTKVISKRLRRNFKCEFRLFRMSSLVKREDDLVPKCVENRNHDYIFTGDRQLRVYQPIKGYRVSIDAILLASVVRCGPKYKKILDVGCGVGGVSLCLAKRSKSRVKITGLDTQQQGLEIFKQNIIENHLTPEIPFVCEGSIFENCKSWKTNESSTIFPNSFDQVVTNPPYFESHNQAVSKNKNRAEAHHFFSENREMGLNNWILKCLKMLRPRGYFHIVHRAQRLGSIISTLEGNCGDIVVLPVFPREDSKDAGRVIVSCRKGSKGETAILRGINIHCDSEKKKYTKVAYDILKNGIGYAEAIR